MEVNIDPNNDDTIMELSVPKFQIVADTIGLPIDQIRFIFAQIIALIIAYFFRVVLHPNYVSAASRHWTALSAGMCISYFCFGKQILLAVFLVVICYCILNLLPPSILHHTTLCASITVLSAVHLRHQIIADEGFVVDITGPLMIIVQKATSLAYSISDGLCKEESKMTPLQRKYFLRCKPSALEYFSYLLCYHSILAGPFFMFTDYQDFIHGTHYMRYDSVKKKLEHLEGKSINNNQSTGDNNNIKNQAFIAQNAQVAYEESHDHKEQFALKEPNPMDATFNKVLGAFLCALIVVVLSPIIPLRRMLEGSFVNSSVAYIFVYILLATTLRRQLYYSAWLLSDAVCSLSGFGFNGYDEAGKAKWDLVSNINIVGVEFGTSLKTTLEAWNIGTMQWLRFLVYERARAHKTLLTYLLSSIWHGFYPGYYLTFLTGAFFTVVARVVRRSLRPRVLGLGAKAMRLYDFTTFFATRICLSYLTFPFVLQKFWPSIAIYRALGFCLHATGLVALFVLPVLLPPVREGAQEKKTLGEGAALDKTKMKELKREPKEIPIPKKIV